MTNPFEQKEHSMESLPSPISQFKHLSMFLKQEEEVKVEEVKVEEEEKKRRREEEEKKQSQSQS